MISAAMTLPELVAVANDYSSGFASLSQPEKEFLITLLKAYADDVLNRGQCIKLGIVVMTKTINGQTAVEILEEQLNGDEVRLGDSEVSLAKFGNLDFEKTD